jgi:hypothetical protein
MAKEKLFENYPAWIVFCTNLSFLATYVAGAFVMFSLAPIWGFLFVVYVVALELNVYREGCTCCYYYGKACASGRGRIAPLIVRRTDPKLFCKRELKFKDFVPQLLSSLIPLVTGAYLLFVAFSWAILAAMLVPILVWFIGNPVVYGKLSCPHCRQGAKCCPALKFFSRKK